MNQYLTIIFISIVLFILLFLTRNTNEGFYNRPRISLRPPPPKPSNGPTVVVAGDASRDRGQTRPVQKYIPYNKKVVSSISEEQRMKDQANMISNVRPQAASTSNIKVQGSGAKVEAAPVDDVNKGITNNKEEVDKATSSDPTPEDDNKNPTPDDEKQPVNNIDEKNIKSIQEGKPSSDSTSASTGSTANGSASSGSASSDSTPAENNTTSGFTGNIFNLRNLFSF